MPIYKVLLHDNYSSVWWLFVLIEAPLSRHQVSPPVSGCPAAAVPHSRGSTAPAPHRGMLKAARHQGDPLDWSIPTDKRDDPVCSGHAEDVQHTNPLPAGVLPPGNWRGHLSFQRPNNARQPSSFLCAALWCMLWISCGGDAGVSQYLVQQEGICHSRDWGEWVIYTPLERGEVWCTCFRPLHDGTFRIPYVFPSSF